MALAREGLWSDKEGKVIMRESTITILLAGCLMGGTVEVSAANLTGVYCGRDGSDTMILDDQGSRVSFEISSWQAGGHYCGTPRLMATRLNGRYEVTDRDCTLSLSSDQESITLLANPSGSCSDQYCGQRAALKKFSLPLSSRQPLPGPFEEISMMETPLCR